MTDLSHYPKTDQFKVIDTIGVPHPFCITAKLVGHASDNFGGMLGKSAIEDYERTHGPSCGIRGCNLSYEEHKQALLIEVDDKRELNDIPELHEYLLKAKPLCEKEGYAGFAFKQK